MKKSIVALVFGLAVAVTSSVGVSQQHDGQAWHRHTECKHNVVYTKKGASSEWATYTFDLYESPAGWTMNCAVRSGDGNGHGSDYTASRYGPGVFGKGKYKDKPTCVVGHPVGTNYTFMYQPEIKRLAVIHEHEPTVFAQCSVYEPRAVQQ